MMESLKKLLKKFPLMEWLNTRLRVIFENPSRGIKKELIELKDIILFSQTQAIQASHPNPLNKFGQKCFSQTDEDGITLEILKRIKQVDSGTYAEFGVGNGKENNTLLLAALGWKGFWVGGEELALNVAPKNSNFAYLKDWITLGNVVELAHKGLSEINATQLDVISLDLDGNDIYFVEKMLTQGLKPKLFIVEYNAKFPPPIRFQIEYDPNHVWQFDDYFGASLTSYNVLFNKFGYKLVCCNSHSGANAFFIEEAFAEFFLDVPSDISQIYVAPRYYLYHSYGHKQSVRTLDAVINRK